MPEFNAGDTVRLKSGGPLMTVAWIDDDNQMARCDWFDKNRDFRSNDFPTSSLMSDDDNMKISVTTL